MAFNLNDFRNQLAFGGARATQFEMNLTIPAIVLGATQAMNKLRFLCHVSSIPESDITPIHVPYFGRKLQYAGDRKSPTALVCSIYNDEDFAIRSPLELWMSSITQHQTTISQFNGSDVSGGYATDGTVIQYSRNEGGQTLKGYQFVGMFPTILSNIRLDWNQTDAIETFDVTFEYQYWLPLDQTGAALAGF